MCSSINLVRVACAGLILAGSGLAVSAQSAKDSFVIYAKAGRINLVTGSAQVRHGNGDAGKILAVSDELSDGDIVSTGTDARLEVLLSPGSFLRVADNTEFRMESTNLEDIRVELKSGSAVIETGGGPDDVLRIAVDLPSGEVLIDRRGVYRLNVDNTRSELLVMNGRAMVQPAMVMVKDGHTWATNGSVSEPVSKFDKKSTHDPLDTWSRERADYLAKANRSLDNRQVAQAFDGFRRLDGFDFALRNSGFWLYSRRRGYCMFVPFDPWNWQSAYGYDYGVFGYYLPRLSDPFHPNGVQTTNTGTINSDPMVKPLDPAPPSSVRTGGTKPAH